MKKHTFNESLVWCFVKMVIFILFVIGMCALDDIITPKTVVENEVKGVVEECEEEVMWNMRYFGTLYVRLPMKTGYYEITFVIDGESNTVKREQSYEKGEIITVTEVKTFGNETLMKTEYK